MILCEKIKIDSMGRVYIPASMREAAELKPGEAYILCNEDTRVITIINKKHHNSNVGLHYPPGVKSIPTPDYKT